MKLKNIHLFLILLIVLILSHFGLVIREGVGEDTEDEEDTTPKDLYLECRPEGDSDVATTKAGPILENPVIQALVAVTIAIITGVIIRKLM
tara:strand:- start:25 stop:297 length:273 start_codon:yes stop_codon:yes gene_type:complete